MEGFPHMRYLSCLSMSSELSLCFQSVNQNTAGKG